jgi:hypothetical protein
MTPHPQAEILRAIADGQQMQLLHESLSPPVWIDCTGGSALSAITSNGRFRIKPRTIMIGNVEVPEPMRVAPLVGTQFWLCSSTSLYPSEDHFEWEGMELQREWLKRGLLHATEQGAKDMLTALVKQLGGVL